MLAILVERSSETQTDDVLALARASAEIPKTIAHMAAGEQEVRHVLGDIFALVSSIRLLGTRKVIAADTARILLEEYEALVEKLDASERVSPFVTQDDFLVPPLPGEGEPLPLMSARLSESLLAGPKPVKDMYKGQTPFNTKGQNDRSKQILNVVLNSEGISIKDISLVVKGCSEKTIQRELAELIRQGRVLKVGERRWSLYLPAPEPPQSR